MCFLSGANQWADYTAFSTADSSLNSTANLFFRDSDYKNLYLNGLPLSQLSPVYNAITQGFGCITFPVYAAEYYEVTGDNGAVAGGSIFGDGKKSNNGYTQTAGSFAHPLGINALPNCIADTTFPEVIISSTEGCGYVPVTATDQGDEPPAFTT